ncbi:hypothetical protein SASPL_105101 [Salvia splendens]|uniref:Pleiotropic ABC efflux transporter N-terminal domain-containing protein n=1 Tax=Salvia splendens TaxID=180675 RepID=A0A8X9A8D6_SALSN|nr:hypothetical protein SASPL_105101 [Salvia splendens]
MENTFQADSICFASNDRVRAAVYHNIVGELALVDVGRIGSDEQEQVLDKLIAAVNEDMEEVGLEFPKVEVRFENLKVDALVHVGSRALPTIPNFIFDMTELRIFSGGRRKETHAKENLHLLSGLIQRSSEES